MRIFNRPTNRYILIGILLLFAIAAYGQSWDRQPRIPANSSGLKAQIEALALRVEALEAENAMLKAGQLNLTSWEHVQISSQILEVGLYPAGRGVWVCDLSETDGERLATQTEFLDSANTTKSVMEAQMFLLQL